MPLAQADRIAFSLSIVSAPVKISAVKTAKAQVSGLQQQLLSLDTANNNLFIPVNNWINSYQTELGNIDGNNRTTIIEQDIQDSAGKKLRNHFFPNDTTQTVPSLASLNNVWPQMPPYALTYAIGKNYNEAYPSLTPYEDAQITTILGFITSLGLNTDIQNTTGQIAQSLLTDPIITFTALQTLATNLIAAVNTWKTTIQAQATALSANSDTNVANKANNTAALNNINNVILPAINTWLAYPTFNPLPGTTTGSAFNATNPATLAPTKLYSVQLTALHSAVTARQAFVTTRTSQVSTVLGSITQDVTNGNITASSGLYGQRYGFLSLRIHTMTGSLTQYLGLNLASKAQDATISSLQANAATYASVCPSSLFQAPGNGTNTIHVVDSSFLTVGDLIYVVSDTQTEMIRAVKSVNGSAVVLNDIVPSKYTQLDNARVYKDLT